MENKKSLNAAELGELWVSYMNASLSSKVFAYFLEKVEDEEINGVIKDAYALSQSALQFITGVFEQDGIPQPVAFTDEDVNVNAPRLFTDNFFLQYIHEYAFLGMTETTTSINRASRQDIYQFYSESYLKFNKLHEKALSVMVSKGVYANPPSIPTPEKIDFVKKQNFLTGWFGERRALLAVEIAGLYSNIQRNLLGATVLTGFSQVATLKEVRQFMLRGIDIAKKHVNIFSELLEASDVPVSMGSDAMVTSSNEISPFSDKLMMFLAHGMISPGIGFYGFSIATNPRRDIAATYTRLTGEILLYAEDGANIMIDNEWLEEPPRMVDREELAKTNNRKE